MQEIADFYLQKLITSPEFQSPQPVDDQELLLPGFLNQLRACIDQYKQAHPNQDITFTETYRSNTLQQIHFNNGASKIKKNGMHHYGIAADSIFIIDGRRTFKGDVKLIRSIYRNNGLTILGVWDPLHVQLIPVGKQQQLRNMVSSTVTAFQQSNQIPRSGEADVATITKARELFIA